MTNIGYAALGFAVLCALVAVSQIKTSWVVFDMSQFADHGNYIPGQGLLLRGSDTIGVNYVSGDLTGVVGGQPLNARGHRMTVAEILLADWARKDLALNLKMRWGAPMTFVSFCD